MPDARAYNDTPLVLSSIIFNVYIHFISLFLCKEFQNLSNYETQQRLGFSENDTGPRLFCLMRYSCFAECKIRADFYRPACTAGKFSLLSYRIPLRYFQLILFNSCPCTTYVISSICYISIFQKFLMQSTKNTAWSGREFIIYVII